MNPRTRFFRGVAVIGALGIGLAACEDTNVVIPETPTIAATPASMTLEVGQTRKIVATLTNLDGGINYQSDNPSVATVSAAGDVTGVGEGSATITVSAANQPTLQTGVDVNVVPSELPPTEEASVSIQSITVGNTTIPVNPANVVNVIALSLNVQRGEADELRVFAGDIEVESCRQTFAAADAPAQITAEDLSLAQGTTVICSINTAAFNISNGQGVPVYANGAYAFRAELRDDGTVIDSAESAPHTFNNADFTVVNLEAPNSAISDVTGLLWHGGSVTATAVPVIFTGAPIASVTFNYDGNILVDSTPDDGFSVVYSSSGAAAVNIDGVEDDEFQVITTSIRSNGQPGPAGDSDLNLPAGVTAFRVDNKDPNPGTFVLADQDFPSDLCCSNNWVGPNYQFSNGKDNEDDDGVGLPASGGVTFHVGAASLSPNAIAALPPVASIAELAETATNTDLEAVAVVKDKLGNSALVALSDNGSLNPLTTLGVDKTAPTADFSAGSVTHMQVFSTVFGAPGGGVDFFQVEFSDAATGGAGPSGFTTTPVMTKLDRWFPGLSATGRCVLNNLPGCPFEPTNGTLDVPGDNGYFTFTATVVDQAGNLSHPLDAPLSRLVLNDQTAPTAGSVVIPSTLTGGQSTAFSVDAADDLNLHKASLRIDFNGVETLPFSAPIAINDQFPASLVTEQTLSQSIPFIRSLEQVDGVTNAPDAGTIEAATAISYLIADAGLNETPASSAIGAAVTPGPSFGTVGVDEFLVSAPAEDICNAASGCADSTPSSRTITVQAIGATGTFANPFQTVHLYYRDGSGVVRYIGAAGAPSVTDDGVDRTWTWSGTFSALGLPTGPVSVFAVGVNSSGDALQAADDTNLTVIEPTV